MGSFKNPLAAAAAWAERMSNPEETIRKKQEAVARARENEAQLPPVPEAEAEPAAALEKISKAENPPRPAAAGRAPRNAESFRSMVWAGCIMVGVVCSLLAFLMGMFR